MKRALLPILSLACLLAACNMSEIENVSRAGEEISFRVTDGGMTKALDVTTANLTGFTVEAYAHGTTATPYIHEAEYAGAAGTFASDHPYYWPYENALDFYAYSQGASTGQVVKVDYRTFTVTPAATASAQADFVYACATDKTKAASTDGAIALNFRHAESKVVVKVKNTAPNLKFVISDWRLGFIDDAGTFTYAGQGAQYDGSTDGNNTAQLAASMWSGNSDATAAKMYTNSLASSVNVAANASESLLDGEMIVIPQSVTAASAYASATAGDPVNGSYVGLKLKILNRENDSVIYSDGNNTAWAIWPANFAFEPGKKYTFTVDLCGGGYYEANHDTDADLDPILEGAVISFASVTVDDFSSQTAVELVAPIPNNGHAYVEIAGIKWATMNVGANSVTDYGLYFQWGDAQGYTAAQVGNGAGKKYYRWQDYKYNDGASSASDSNMTKYNSSDGKTVLDLLDDGVNAEWGGAWRMPTTAEWQALGAAVNTEWTTDYQGTGVVGLVCTDKTNSSKVLFFPAAGTASQGSVSGVGTYCNYWSSSLHNNYATTAYRMQSGSSIMNWNNNNDRYRGFTLRGVCDF